MRMVRTEPGGRGSCLEFLESGFWEEEGNSVGLGGIGREGWMEEFLGLDEGGGMGGKSAVDIL